MMTSGHKSLRWAAAAASVLLFGTRAFADGRDCTGYGALSDNPTVDSAKIAGDAKTFFVKRAMDDKACPSDAAKCRRKGFLLPGNSILVSARTGPFVCAIFVNGKGVETDGWLPATSAAIDKRGATPTAQDWSGTWIREEAEIKIKPDAKAGLAIDGDATYGAKDPDRVKRGAVNMGSIGGKVVPSGDKLSFAMDDGDRVLPVDKGDDTTCKVWMRRVGLYLLVDDNNNCGGMNVSFRGTYSRK